MGGRLQALNPEDFPTDEAVQRAGVRVLVALTLETMLSLLGPHRDEDAVGGQRTEGCLLAAFRTAVQFVMPTST